MADEPATTPPQARRPSIRAALLAALEASGAWSTPADAANELEAVLKATLIGVIKLDAQYIPWAVTLVDQFNRDISEAVCALAPPTDLKH